jgi:hypothetical protein
VTNRTQAHDEYLSLFEFLVYLLIVALAAYGLVTICLQIAGAM